MMFARGLENELLQVYGKHLAVHNLSLHLNVDEITALLGHNGAGKSICVHAQLTNHAF